MSTVQSPQTPDVSHIIQRSGPRSDPLTRTIYLLAPLAIITATLLFHAHNNPVPAATLSVLITAAYGHTLWQEYVATRPLTALFARHALHEQTETKHTITRNVRDTLLAVQPTTR